MKYLYFFPFIFLYLAFPSSTTAQGIFSTTDYTSFLEEVNESGKPYFIYFSMKNNSTCQQMANETFSDPNLQNFIRHYAYAYQVDIQTHPDGMAIAYQWGVEKVPELVFFRPNGSILCRLSGFISADMLMKKMMDIGADKYINLDKPAYAQAQERGESQGGENAKAEARKPSASKSNTQLERFDEFANNDITIADINGLEKFSPTELVEPGFGLLIKSDQNLGNIKAQVARFEKVWTKGITVYSESFEEITEYRLVLGSFPTREEAKIYAASIERMELIKVSIIDLKTLLTK